MNITYWDILGRLGLAFLIGGLLGTDRTIKRKAAGIKTHALVCLVCAMVSMISKEGLPGSDPSRIISNILTGIGFLAGGVIFTIGKGEGVTIKGLTTAAGLFGTACIGIPIGLGYYVFSCITFLFIELAFNIEWILHRLHILPHFEKDDGEYSEDLKKQKHAE